MSFPPDVAQLYMDRLAALFASSETLCSKVGKVPELVRNEHVRDDYAWYEMADGKLLYDLRPIVVISDEEFGFVTDTYTADGGIGVIHAGSSYVLITDNAVTPGENTPEGHTSSKRIFRAFVSRVMDDVMRASGKDDNLLISGVETVLPFTRTNVRDRTWYVDFWEVAFRVNYGTEP